MYRDEQQVDVLFLVEHKDRELNSVCAIAVKLKEQYGLKVAIASINFHTLFSAFLIRPRVVVVPFALCEADFPVGVFRSIYGDNIIYASMNLEQILHANNIEYKRPRDYFTKKVLKHFCWSNDFKEFLLASGVDETNIFITGNPATTLFWELAKKSVSLKQQLAQEYRLPEKAVWHFFPLNDGWAFLSDNSIKARIANGYNEKNAWKYKSYMMQVINQLIQWLIDLGKERDPDYVIILRPHPSVAIDEYERLFQQAIGKVPDYIVLSKDLSSREWTIVCDTCYTTFSTVSLDAEMLGKPVFLLEPTPFPDFLHVPQLAQFPVIKDCANFASSLSSYDRTRGLGQETYEKNTIDAIEKTAYWLSVFCHETGYPKLSLSALYRGLVVTPRQLGGSVIRWLAVKSGINPFGVVKPGMFPDYFSGSEVGKILGGNRA